jgi:hypothetical protein
MTFGFHGFIKIDIKPEKPYILKRRIKEIPIKIKKGGI